MANKEMEKQSFLALVQLHTQLSQQFIQLAQIAANPQVIQMMPAVAQMATQAAMGFTELERRLLEQYDIRNPEDILVDAAILQSAAQTVQQGGLLTPGAFGGAMPDAQGAAPAQGMGGLPPDAGAGF